MKNRKNKPIFDAESVKIMVSHADVSFTEEQVDQLSAELEAHYRKSTQNIIHFDQLKECSRMDIEKYRDAYDSMFDVNGAVTSHTIGFNFSLRSPDDAEDEIYPEEQPEYVKEMVKTLQPVQIWVGTQRMKDQMAGMGIETYLFPYFQDGGFMVLLKTPVFRPMKKD